MNAHLKKWKFATLPVVAISIIAIYPQLSLFLAKGGNWRGSYFSTNYDEAAYSAYVNALANGNPRRFDPFLGKAQDFESLYSIQFIPAYLIAWPARLLGISTSAAFIILGIFIGICSALALFFLIREITSDDLLAAAGTVAILCFGTAASYQGELRFLIEGRVLVEYLPFLRRYQPGLAFPVFFVFCLLTWRGLKADDGRAAVIYSLSAGLLFAVLVFSYFYIWTAAAAWITCLSIVWLLGRLDEVKKLITFVVPIGICALAALVPYFVLLGARSAYVDSTQLLTTTRIPDLTAPPLLIGILVVAAIYWTIRKGVARFADLSTIFALTFALTPLILFNQQIVTGRSIQPVHYEIFIANYLVLTAAVTTAAMWIRARATETILPFRRGLVYLLLIAFGWGLVESIGVSGRSAAAAVIRDESIPALRYIQDHQSGEVTPQPSAILSNNFVTADIIPTETTLRPLWNAHSNSAGGISAAETKRLFYLYLYYNGFTPNDLTVSLTVRSFEVTSALFGADRALPELAEGVRAVRADEISSETRAYAEFIRNFSRTDATNPVVSWLIVPVKSDHDLSNIDRWYNRDQGQELGMFKVYRLELK